MCRLAESPSIKLSEIWKIGFKKVSQLREHSPIPRQAIDNQKEEMAFRRKFVVEDRIGIVGDLIYTFNENPPTDFLRKLVIAAEPENKGILIYAPKEIIEIQIDLKKT